MAEVVPYGNKSKTRRSARISKIKIAKDSKESSLLTVPPGFEQKRKDQGVLHEGSKNHEEEKSVKAPEIEDDTKNPPDGEKKKSKPDRFYTAPGYRKLPSPVSPAVKDGWKITEEPLPPKINEISVATAITSDQKLLEIGDGTSTTEDTKHPSFVMARVKMIWKKKIAPVKIANKLSNPSILTTPAKVPPIIGEELQNSSRSNPFDNVAAQSRKILTKPRELPMVGKKTMQAKKKQTTDRVENVAKQAHEPKNTKNVGKSKAGRKSERREFLIKADDKLEIVQHILDAHNGLSQEEDATKDNLDDIIPSGDDWESRYDSNTLEDPESQKQRAYASKFLECSAGLRCAKPAPGKLIIDTTVMKDYGYVYNYQQHQMNKSNAQNMARDQAYASVINLIDGDLFDSPCSLAHCVSADFTMSSGIAVSFRRRFGHVAELLDQRKQPGEVAILKIGDRFVHYLVSKELYLTKPVGVTMVSKCLLAMKEHCLQMGITELAMPKIGCGRDNLQWSQVSATIVQTFAGSGIRVNVYTMKEQTLPWSRKRPAPTPMLLSPPYAKMSKLDWMPAPQELLPSRPLVVLHHFGGNILTPQQPSTAVTRIFLGCCDGAPGGPAVHLSTALKIWPDYVKHDRKLGGFVPMLADKVCSLICRQSSTALINFTALHKAAKELAHFVKIMGITNLMFEGFVEDQDNVVTFKVITLLRLAFYEHSATLTVVWPVEPPYGNMIRASQQNFLSKIQQPPQILLQGTSMMGSVGDFMHYQEL